MGQKVNPHGLRVGVIKDWDSRWYAESEFADYLAEDYKLKYSAAFVGCSAETEASFETVKYLADKKFKNY